MKFGIKLKMVIEAKDYLEAENLIIKILPSAEIECIEELMEGEE